MNDENHSGIRFIADEMLGRLARWLRAMGYDTVYYNGGGDNGLVQQALTEDRIILTRDTHFLERKMVKKIALIRSDKPKEQLRQVVGEFDLKFDNRLFTLCIMCNHKVFPVEKEKIRDRIHEYTFLTYDSFYECPCCKRIYWAGTHKDNMLEFINSVVS